MAILNTLLSEVIKTATTTGQTTITGILKNTIEKKGNAILTGGQNNVNADTGAVIPVPVPAPAASAAAGWDCPCGHKGNAGKFCAECGKPQPAAGWDCPCGQKGNTSKFCAECGKPQPAAGWDCPCGQKGNTGKFCAECGKPKPAGVPQYKCDKCSWQPKDMANLPKFCPDCGDPFDDGDIVK
jgi:hypothetical protein